MALHSRLSPSALKPTKLCPGRVLANDGVQRFSDIYAAEGSLLHSIAEDCIEQDFEPTDFIGQKRRVDGFEIEVTADMAECMMDALDWIRDQPGKLFVETKVFLDPWMPGQWGFLDLAILNQRRDGKWVLTIFDWKFGIGMVVPIFGNYQLRAYALAFIETVLKPLGIIPDEIVLIIEQPRAFGKAPRFYDQWAMTYEELLPFGEEMAAIRLAAEQPNAPRYAGKEQCYSCSRAVPGQCNAFDQWHLDMLELETLDGVDNIQMPEPELLTDKRRVFLVKHKSTIEGWMKAIVAQALDAAIVGLAPPGLKAIEGDSGDREWRDPAVAELLMVEGEWVDPETGEIITITDSPLAEPFTRKVLSPAQVEKVVKKTRTKPGNPELWDKLQTLITKKPSKPQLVLASDPRPAIAEFEFDELP